jgi:hypothetical protein
VQRGVGSGELLDNKVMTARRHSNLMKQVFQS